MKTTILTKITKSAVICLVSSLALAYCRSATAQGSAFSYQGQLMDGTGPANGTYDLLFTINDSPDPSSLFLAWVGRPGVLVSNGLFTVTLDFPGQQFNTGAPRWLEIHVQKTGSTNGLTTLLP